MSYDAALGCVFLLNPNTEEMVAIWDATRTITMFSNCRYAITFSAPVISANASVQGRNYPQAHFVTKDGRILVPDIKELGPGTMNGAIRGVPSETSELTLLNRTASVQDTGDLTDTNIDFTEITGLVNSRLYV